jgi:hypothetical protein
VDWAAYTPPVPSVHRPARCSKNFDLADLASCIDWAPFFQTWDLAASTPDILRDEVVGSEAQRVFSDGKRLLQRLIEGRWLQANGVMALLPANTVDDDTIEIYTDETRSEVALRWSPLRLQTERPVIDGVARPNRSLADFIAPPNTAARPTTSASLPSPPAWASRRRKRSLRPNTTTTAPSCSRPWPTVWPRPLPSGCTSVCAPTCGATQPTKRWTKRAHQRAVPRHPPRAGLPGLPRPQRQARHV